MKLLLSKSASVTLRNVLKRTPLDVAIECRSIEAASNIVDSQKYVIICEPYVDISNNDDQDLYISLNIAL